MTIYIPLWAILPLATYALLVLFWAVMTLRRSKINKTLTMPAFILGLPALIIGYFLDWFVNQTLGRIIFCTWRLPAFEIVTARLQRYADGPDCWQRRRAWWIDHNLLRHADPVGYHVKWPELNDGK